MPHFKRYTVQDNDIESWEQRRDERNRNQEQDIELEQIRKIVEECNPEEDEVDKRILFEWTGIKLVNSDYLDDTSADEVDIAVFIDNLIGYDDSVTRSLLQSQTIDPRFNRKDRNAKTVEDEDPELKIN